MTGKRSPQAEANIDKAKAWLRQNGAVNERTLASKFAKDFGDRWRFNVDEGYWLQWVGTHWARGQTPEFLESLGEYASGFSLLFHATGDITRADMNRFHSQRTVAAMERICRSLPSFLARSVLFDSDPFLLGTPGGTVDLRTGELWAAEPEDFITVLAPVTPAAAGTPLGPRFTKFLDDITAGDPDFARTLQQWFGISATGSSRDQKILFLYGPGGNGKGVLLRTVAALLGDHAVNAPLDLLTLNKHSNHATHKVDVLNARMALATEVDDDSTWDVALVKSLTGGDPISVNRMRQDPFRVTARCSITISGNHKPALKDVDEAVRRRFIVATFALKVEKPIPDLEKQFVAEEGPAILRWIVDGAAAREAEGELFVAASLQEDTEDYFAEEDALGDFIMSHLEPAAGEKVKTAEVYEEWKRYCERFRRASGARNTFTTAMKAADIKYHRDTNGRYFLNVRLKLSFD